MYGYLRLFCAVPNANPRLPDCMSDASDSALREVRLFPPEWG